MQIPRWIYKPICQETDFASGYLLLKFLLAHSNNLKPLPSEGSLLAPAFEGYRRSLQAKFHALLMKNFNAEDLVMYLKCLDAYPGLQEMC